METIIRTKHLTYEVPEREIDEFGIQKYKPDQHGFWLNGTHDWIINSKGWPGPLPESYDNLITTIGNSHIENFMNPVDCRQSVLLKERVPQYNFFEASISGMPFIEMIRVAENLKSYNPKMQMLFVKNPDFPASISNIAYKPDVTQIDTTDWKIRQAELKNPGIKKVIYSSKFAFYIFNEARNRIDKLRAPKVQEQTENSEDSLLEDNLGGFEGMFKYVVENYDTKNYVLVFLPNTNPELVNTASKYFKVYKFSSEFTDKWKSAPEDYYHWNCEGHVEAAGILSAEIPNFAELFNSEL